MQCPSQTYVLVFGYTAEPPQYKQMHPTQPPLYVEHLAYFVLSHIVMFCAPDPRLPLIGFLTVS
jgi:hypothetical protein